MGPRGRTEIIEGHAMNYLPSMWRHAAPVFHETPSLTSAAAGRKLSDSVQEPGTLSEARKRHIQLWARKSSTEIEKLED